MVISNYWRIIRIIGNLGFIKTGIRHRCAEEIPKIIPILGIPWYSRDFQMGGRISRAAGFAVHAYMRTRININQRIIAFAQLHYY